MSKKSLGLFVHRLHQELEGYKEYRSVMNLEQHTFVFNKRTLVAQTLAQLKKGGSEIPPDIRRKMKIALTDLANKHGDLLIAKLEEVASFFSSEVVRFLPKNITIYCLLNPPMWCF